MLKKGFIGLVVFAMVFGLFVTGAPVMAAGDGDNVKIEGSSTVYYVNGGKLYVYPNEKTFMTWYSDWSSVMTISKEDLSSFNGGVPAGNVTYRSGTMLVTTPSVDTVYAVEPGGVLRSVVSEENVKALYGDNWASMVSDVPAAFMVNYTVGEPLMEGYYPVGTIVKEAEASTTYVIGEGMTRRPVATGEAFDANMFNWGNLVIADDLSMYSDGTSITGAEDMYTVVAGTGGSVGPTPGGSVSVSLAASTPGATTIISDSSKTGQALIPMTTVNFTAPADGDVTVTNLKYKRTGISADADIMELYLYDGMERLYQGGSMSSNYATFNSSSGLFTVPAGTTKAVTLKIDLEQATSAGKTMGFQLEEVTTSNNATVSGSLPVAGNLMTTASVSDMGYVDTSFGNVPGSAATVNPGEEDFEAYKIGINANAQDLDLEYLKLTLLGSVNVDDLQNFRLTVGGTEIATGEIDENRELVFDMTGSPYKIEKGQTKILSVRCDVIKGSTRTFRFAVEYSSDLILRDRNYNVYIIPIDNGTAASTWASLKSSSSSNAYTVNEGSLAISLDNSTPTDNVPVGATNVKLGTWKFEASGEDVKVKTLDVNVDTSGNTGLDNGKVLVDGVQIGSTADLTEVTDVSFSFGSSFIVPAGEYKLVDVYADMKGTSGTNVADSSTVVVTLGAGSGNAQGTASLTSIDAPSSDNATGSLTASSAALTVSAYSAYGNQNIVKPAVQSKVGSFVVSAGAYEGMNIDTINVDNATSGVMQNMKLMDHESGVQYGSTKVTLTSTTATDNVFSVSLDLEASESRVIDIYADVKSGAGANTIDLDVGAIATSESTGTTDYHNASSDGDADVSLQTMTITTGSITSAADGSKPDAGIVIAGTTATMNAIKFTAANEAFTVTKVRIEEGTAANYDNVGKVVIEYPNKAGNTVSKTGYLNASGQVDFTGLDMYVPKDDTAVMTVKAELSTISSGADSGDTPGLDFDSDNNFYALGESSNTADEDPDTDVNGNDMIVRKTVPTITLESLPTTVLNDGTQTLSKFTITADSAGDVYFKEMNWTYATTSGVDVTNSTIYLYDVNDQSTALNTAESLTKDGSNVLEVVLTNEEVVAAGSSKTYVLKGTVTGSAANKSLSFNLKSSASAATAGTSTTYTLLALYETGGILWSDGSATPHASTSADYADCTYVKNLPTDSQTMSK